MSGDPQHPAALGLAGRVLAREAEQYLRACGEFLREGHDPHAAARLRAARARAGEASRDRMKAETIGPRCDYCGTPQPRRVTACTSCAPARAREARRAGRIAARDRRLEQVRAPFRFAPCDVHGLAPCGDDCPTFTGRLDAAGIPQPKGEQHR